MGTGAEEIGDETERSEATSASRRELEWVLRGILPGDRTRTVLRGQRLVIGRDDEAEVRLTHSRISRQHAELHRQGPIYALRDLGSTNGSYANGARVAHCAIRPDLVLRIGDWLGLVEQSVERPHHPFTEIHPGIFGGDHLAEVVKTVKQAATSTLPLELVGETGTGKDLLARAFHAHSRRSGAFHAINCAALPGPLVEGELFGYRRGAFTGAERAHLGQLRASHGGTLFLDEVAELAPEIQAKLLRVLELKEVVPLGETQAVSFDTRIVVASQRPLSTLVTEGRFRADLAARLTGMSIEIPALRDRRADIPSLFAQFLRQHAPNDPPTVGTKLYERLCLYAWPGNVRELEMLARNVLVRFPDELQLRTSHLPSHFQDSRDSSPPDPQKEPETRSDHDHRKFVVALERTGGNVKAAAESVGISRQRAYRLMQDRPKNGSEESEQE